MAHRNKRTARFEFLLIANTAVFFCSLVISTVAYLIAQNPGALTHRANPDIQAQVRQEVETELDQKYQHLLQQAKHAIELKDSALSEIRSELTSGYVVSKDIEVTDTNEAYWLSEPKLMLGVTSLSGGQLHINFADRSEVISVGERIEFKVDDCDCFLLLKASRFGKASFRFACNPADAQMVSATSGPFLEARLN